jgi:hypothetical protein
MKRSDARARVSDAVAQASEDPAVTTAAAGRWPTIPIVFRETRKLAQEWTYRYLAAAHH